jgi:hypothetical protein
MKKTIIIIFFMPILILAQVSGYTDTFSGPLTASGPSSFQLTQSNGSLGIQVEKESSKLWQSVEIPFPEYVDITAYPHVNIKLKSNVSTLLTVHLVDGYLVEQRKSIKVYTSQNMVTYYLDFSDPSSLNKSLVNKIRLTANGNSIDAFSCELIIDEIRIGDDASLIAGIGAVPNQKVFINSIDNNIKLLDIRNAAGLELSASNSSIINMSHSEISNGFSLLSFSCADDYVGTDTIFINVLGEEGFSDNLIAVPIEIEDNYPPEFEDIISQDILLGDTLEIMIKGINDGNATVEQDLLISASSSDQSILPDSNIIITFEQKNATAEMRIIPIGIKENLEVIIDLDDQFPSNNIYSSAFFINTFAELNHPPQINKVADQFVYIENGDLRIELTGITDGDGSTQNLNVAAESSNELVLPDSMIYIEYASPSEYASMTLKPLNTGNTVITITIEDDGGNEFNNGDLTSAVSFNLEVLNLPKEGHAADFSSFQNWGRDFGNGQQEYELGTFKGRDKVLKINLNNKSCWTGTVYNTPELNLENHRYLSYDIYFEGESFGNYVGGRTHCYLYDEGWDPDIDRNLPAAHAQRKFAVPDQWKTVLMDFRSDDGIQNNLGEDINIKRIRKVLLNYASNFTWPFPIDNGTVYISNLRIGNEVADSLVPILDYQCTIDPISNQTAFRNESEKSIALTGISSGQPGGSIPSLIIASSDTSVIPLPEISDVDSLGNALLQYSTMSKTGRSRITVTVSSEGSADRTTGFNIDVIDEDIYKTADVEIFPDSAYQTFRGFGTFQFSDRPNYIDKYTDELGASAVRLGIIGNQIEPVNDNNDPDILNLEAFNYGAFNFEHYRELKRKGVETFILTSWSPPAWMKRNLSVDYGYASAPFYEQTDNILEPYYYDEFAESMVAVVKMFKIKADIDL